MFYELQLPAELSVNYMKYQEGFFKGCKLKKMLKTFLLSVKMVENFTEFHDSRTFVGFLKRAGGMAVHGENIDHVPVQVKIRYLVSLIKNNFA